MTKKIELKKGHRVKRTGITACYGDHDEVATVISTHLSERYSDEVYVRRASGSIVMWLREFCRKMPGEPNET